MSKKSFTSKHSTSSKFTFTTPKDFEFTSLKDLAREYGLSQVHKVNALYINKKGHYGDAPVVITDTHLVNMPNHMLENVLDVLADSESICLINDGYVGFTLYTYENEYGVNVGLEWEDIEPSTYEKVEPKKPTKQPTKHAKKASNLDEEIPF